MPYKLVPDKIDQTFGPPLNFRAASQHAPKTPIKKQKKSHRYQDQVIFQADNLMNVLEIKQPKIAKNHKKSRKTALNLEKAGKSLGE